MSCSRNALLDDVHPDERRRPRRPEGVRIDHGQLSMAFERKVLETPVRLLVGLVRPSDPIESQRAAVDVLPHRTGLQSRILAALKLYGPMTDPELTALDTFEGCGESTVRTRRAELVAAGHIVKVGRKGKHGLWSLVTPAKSSVETTV